jgi:hypothetical protein
MSCSSPYTTLQFLRYRSNGSIYKTIYYPFYASFALLKTSPSYRKKWEIDKWT